MKVPLTVEITAETSPGVAAAIKRIESQSTALNSRQRQAQMQALAILRQRTIATNALNAAEMQAARVVREPSMWTQFKGGARSALSSSVGAGFIGGIGGGLVATGLAAVTSAAYSVVNSFKDVALSSIKLADELSDTAAQLGTSKEEAFRIQLGAGYAGVARRSLFSAVDRTGEVLSKAQGGDKEALRLLATYGISGDEISGMSPITAIQRVRKSLGKEGAQTKDLLGLKAILGENPNRILAAFANMPKEDTQFAEAITKANKFSTLQEVYDLEKKKRDMENTAALPNVFKYAWQVLNQSNARLFGEAYAKVQNNQTTAGADDLGERVAGTWTPPETKKQRKKSAMMSRWNFELDKDAFDRAGGAVSLAGMYARKQLQNVQERSLDRLTSIDKKLGGTLQMEVSGLD